MKPICNCGGPCDCDESALPAATTAVIDPHYVRTLTDRLRVFIRASTTGQCRILSSECKCPLCAVDSLEVALIRVPVAPAVPAPAEAKDECQGCGHTEARHIEQLYQPNKPRWCNFKECGCHEFVHKGLHGNFTDSDLAKAGQDWPEILAITSTAAPADAPRWTAGNEAEFALLLANDIADTGMEANEHQRDDVVNTLRHLSALAAAPSGGARLALGQAWVSRMTNTDGPDVSLIGRLKQIADSSPFDHITEDGRQAVREAIAKLKPPFYRMAGCNLKHAPDESCNSACGDY